MKFSVLAGTAILAVASAESQQYKGTWKSIGCYVDRSDQASDLTIAHTTKKFNSVSQCTDYCALLGAYKYAAPQGDSCYCGQGLDSDKVKDEECDIPCPGFATEMCGGVLRLSVYVDETYKQSNATTDLGGPSSTTATSAGSQGTAAPVSTTSSATTPTTDPVTGGAGKLGGYGALAAVAGLLVL
ncbi:hypothetical protein QBC42DRAFT_273437 [Cladorrhinum samala]|uniref:WSC domain-containing protein n=1 Tax=Cladorrhinum samala TaxID=585594 RepID=A0AAV9HKJ5_9PEZI|nr:hypothetical protein QBC42DRAFT_273437 [Cladorrhinum samala]